MNILHELGFHAEKGASDESNEKGYWENPTLWQINIHILEYFGGNQVSFPKFCKGWEYSSPMRRFDGAASALIESLNEHSNWALKDPRLSMTLPYWRRFLPTSTKFLVCIRNPIDTARSISAMWKISYEESLKVWMALIVSAISVAPASRTMIVSFDDYFDSSDEQVKRIKDFVGSDSRTNPMIQESRLRHFSTGRPARLQGITQRAIQLYDDVRGRTPGVASSAPVDLILPRSQLTAKQRILGFVDSRIVMLIGYEVYTSRVRRNRLIRKVAEELLGNTRIW